MSGLISMGVSSTQRKSACEAASVLVVTRDVPLVQLDFAEMSESDMPNPNPHLPPPQSVETQLLSWRSKSKPHSVRDDATLASLDFRRRAATCWLEYDDPQLEERYVHEWLYRWRHNLTALAVGCIGPFLTFAFTTPAWNWSVYGDCVAAGLCLVAAVVNFAWGSQHATNSNSNFASRTSCCLRENASPIMRSTRVPEVIDVRRRVQVHETMFAIVCVALGIFAASHYAYIDACQALYTEAVAMCANRIPLPCVLPACPVAVAIAARLRLKLPFILVVFPLAAFLPRLWYPVEIEPVSVTAIKAGVTVCLAAVFAGVAIFTDQAERASFEAGVIAAARAQRAVALRQAIDETLAGSLPLAVAKRLTVGASVCDGASMATVGLCELFDFASLAVQQLLPATTMRVVNDLFSTFDRFAAKLQCSRLKAVGDLYIVAAGLQAERNPTEACAAVVRVALLQLKFVEHAARALQVPLAVRLLVHSGRALGGLVGQLSFSYELFGPAIDTAKSTIGYCPVNAVTATDAAHSLLGLGPAPLFHAAPLFPISGAEGVNLLFRVHSSSSSSGSGSNRDETPDEMAASSSTDVPMSDVSTGFDSGSDGTDMRYRALRAAALSERREDTLLDGLSSLSVPVESTRGEGSSGGGNPLSDPDVIPPAVGLKSLGRDVLQQAEELLEASRPAGVMALAFRNPQVERLFRKFETANIRRMQMKVAVLNLVVIAAVAGAAGADTKGNGAAGGFAACGVVLVYCAVWLAAVGFTSWLQDLICNRLWTVGLIGCAFVGDLIAVSLFPRSIVNVAYFSLLPVLLCLLIAGSPSFVGTVVVGAGSTAAIMILGWSQVDRAVFRNVALGATILTLASYGTFQVEKSLRAHFETVCLSNAQLRACEDELAMQRKMYELLLPPSLAKATVDFKLRSKFISKSFIVKYSQIVVVAVRIDGMSAAMSRMIDDPQAALEVAGRALGRIEDVLRRATTEHCPAELARISDELLCKVSTLGDEVMLGGPLLRVQAPDAVVSLSAVAALRLMHMLMTEDAAMGDAAAWSAFQFTMVAAFHSASLVLLESACLSLQLYGTGPWQAQALLRAAPRGFVGCTEGFKVLAERQGRLVPEVGLSIGSCELWRVRGVGAAMVAPIDLQRH